MTSSYQVPSEVLQRTFLPPKAPGLTLSADHQWMLFRETPPLPSIASLALPEKKLAGVRFDPLLWAPSRLEYATSPLVAQHIASGQRIPILLPKEDEQEWEGTCYIRFNPNPPSGQQQFVVSAKDKHAPRLVPFLCTLPVDAAAGEEGVVVIPLFSSPAPKLNFVNGCAYQFSNAGTQVYVSLVPKNQEHVKNEEVMFLDIIAPSMQSVEPGARKAPGRTYQDLLSCPQDERDFVHYFSKEIVVVDVNNGKKLSPPRVVPQSQTRTTTTSKKDQRTTGRLIHSLKSSPCGRFLLAYVMDPNQLSYSVPLSRFGKTVEVWDTTSSSLTLLATIPIDDDIPLSYDACSRHARSFFFHPCQAVVLDNDDDDVVTKKNSLPTILYVQAVDGGDPEQDPVDGARDVLYALPLKEANDNGASSLPPAVDLEKESHPLVRMEWRFDDIAFTDDDKMAIVSEYRWKDRMERTWKLSLAATADASSSTNVVEDKTLMWERCWQDRYQSPGAPMTRRGRNGQSFLVQSFDKKSIYLQGAGASPLGDRPFLDQRSLDGGDTKRVWRCKAPVEGDLVDATKEVNGVLPTVREDIYESIVLLMKDNDTLLMSRESKTTPRNYYLTKLSDLATATAVTSFPHPQPDLLGVTKELVHYERPDGVELTANLYLPPKYDGSPRPTLFWAYPREFKNAKAAGQVKGSKHRFVSADWASPIHWAAKGWAVMDDFSLPVIGEGDTAPNDNFVEQIVMGATAAVEYATQTRGIAHPDKCAVGGHSYGSFMTAHLLSHTSLFAAGIGRSGAFNRTLTPMSFQSEDRSMWDAPEVYITMSPIMHAKKYSEQSRVGKMLLIHGEADENSGTHPLQSERYFAALKAFGIESRLCKLPYERHSYRAKESILHMAWEQEEWLKSLE